MGHCWMLHSASATGKPKVYCSWPEATKYYRDLRERIEPLLDRNQEQAVVKYFIEVEEFYRQSAFELLRTSVVETFGEALILSMEKYTNAFYDFSHILSARATSATSSQGAAGMVPPPIPPANARAATPADAKSPSKGGQGSNRPATSTHTSKNSKICKRYNDRRGCPTPCKAGEAHCCDVLLQSGRVCEQKHSRIEHDPRSHGAWAERP